VLLHPNKKNKQLIKTKENPRKTKPGA